VHPARSSPSWILEIATCCSVSPSRARYTRAIVHNTGQIAWPQPHRCSYSSRRSSCSIRGSRTSALAESERRRLEKRLPQRLRASSPREIVAVSRSTAACPSQHGAIRRATPPAARCPGQHSSDCACGAEHVSTCRRPRTGRMADLGASIVRLHEGGSQARLGGNQVEHLGRQSP